MNYTVQWLEDATRNLVPPVSENSGSSQTQFLRDMRRRNWRTGVFRNKVGRYHTKIQYRREDVSEDEQTDINTTTSR